MEYLLCGFFTCAAFLAVLWRMDIRKFIGYPVILDVVAVLVFSMILHGTYVGMASALIAGLMFSASITILRRTMGYKRFNIIKGKWEFTQPNHNLTIMESLKCFILKLPKPLLAFIAVLLIIACVS